MPQAYVQVQFRMGADGTEKLYHVKNKYPNITYLEIFEAGMEFILAKKPKKTVKPEGFTGEDTHVAQLPDH